MFNDFDIGNMDDHSNEAEKMIMAFKSDDGDEGEKKDEDDRDKKNEVEGRKG